jgi:peptidoglycan/LPS O-acetylase OafA/YrhL
MIDQLGTLGSFFNYYFVGVLVAVHLVGARALASSKLLLRWRGIIRALSARTFSIYLFHFPLLIFFSAIIPQEWPHAGRALVVIGAASASIYGLAFLTEAQKHRWRTAIHAVRCFAYRIA